MSRARDLIVWLFAASLISGSCAITFYTAKLSLGLKAEQENFKRSSISALVQNAALSELSKFEDVVYAAAIKFDAEQAAKEMLDRVDWLIQVDQFAYPENQSKSSDQFSLTRPASALVELDPVTKAMLFESSNKLNSRLLYISPISTTNQNSILTAGLTLKKGSQSQHFVIYLSLEGLFDKIVEELQPLAAITLGDLRNTELSSNSWKIQIPNLDVPVSVTTEVQSNASADLTQQGLKSLTRSIFIDENMVTVISLNIALWLVIALMLREYYYRPKAQKHAFEINAQAEKNTNLAMLGELATSIAHEINQPLAVMQMRASMLMDKDVNGPSSDALNENLQVIQDQVRRCSKIVQSVKSLSSKKNTEAEKFKLDDFFRDIRTILDLQSQKYDGRLDFSCPNNLYVEFNKTALEQIALNLSRNGFEAMRHLPKTKRILTIKAKACERSHKSPTVIEFIDRGKGLTKANRERVFDAFYSTKNTGTGLGLALSKTLAERNNAHISVESKEGVGSCFQVKIEAGNNTAHGTLATHEGQA